MSTNPSPKKTGRPKGSGLGVTEFRQIYNKHAFRLALLGYNDEEIARELGIGWNQFKKWKRVHAGFAAGIEKGRARASARVAKSLMRNALGFWVEDSETKTTTNPGPNGQPVSTSVTVTKRKYVAPNVTAQIFWLKNRARQHWYDTVALPAIPPVDPSVAGKAIRDAVKAIRQLEGMDASSEEGEGDASAG